MADRHPVIRTVLFSIITACLTFVKSLSHKFSTCAKELVIYFRFSWTSVYSEQKDFSCVSSRTSKDKLF